MIRCFFDDSGKESERGNRIVSIAGYLAGGETYWDLFGTGWSHQLFRHGISWLHMKDFMQDRDEYAAFKWDWPKKRSVLEDFIKVIKVSQIIGFGVALDAEAWRKVPKQFTAVEGTAQEFCFLRIMRMIVERMKIVRPNDYVSVFFDCDKGFTPAGSRNSLASAITIQKRSDIFSHSALRSLNYTCRCRPQTCLHGKRGKS